MSNGADSVLPVPHRPRSVPALLCAALLLCTQTLALSHLLAHLDAEGYVEPDCAACTLGEAQTGAADPGAPILAAPARYLPPAHGTEPAAGAPRPSRFHARAPPSA